MLLCAVLQCTLVKEVYIHALHQDERAQVAALHRGRKKKCQHELIVINGGLQRIILINKQIKVF